MPRRLPFGHPDRDMASLWAERYRKAMASPNGVYAEYDKDGYRLIYIDATDPKYLVSMLENMARLGTFRDRELDDCVEKLCLRMEVRDLRNDHPGLSASAEVDMLADKYLTRGRGWSKENIERKLGRRT